ncbi:MAG: alpha/beta fold hydrolase [Thermodesulfobacteriota bacterium]|nr:alpha/beta fold hydrolase [Thermodesulfobacteriota bacterium]
MTLNTKGGKLKNKEAVILVHGLWMNGMEMSLLKHRLNRFGYQPWSFRYSSTRLDLTEIATRLNTFVEQIPAQTIHFVGHSLGGLVILKLFEIFPRQRPGRIIALSPPYQGSETARRLIRLPGGRNLIGRSIIELLDGDIPAWSGERDLGVIGGTLNFGFGRLIGAVGHSGDGTIRLEEMRIPKARDFITLRVSHMGLVVSKRVATEVYHFLEHGRFSTVSS